MDSSLRDFNLNMRNRVSHYQKGVQNTFKESECEKYDGRILFTWSIPIALSLCELIYLKHGKSAKARNMSLAKWTSIILATVWSNFETRDVLKRLHYFDVNYPNPTQMQVEMMRNHEILAEIEKNKQI